MQTLSFRHWASAALLAGGLLGSLPTLADQPPPEAASGFARITAPTAFDHAMIVTANPLASDAGAAILRQGGSAVDALIAAQWVLGLTEPQSSGLGGGGFLLTHDGKRTLQSWDGRETAPAAARDERFIGADGKPLPFSQAVASGKAVGVPGEYGMMPPVWLEGFGTYLRCDSPDAHGYWLMFQDAETGEILDMGLSPRDA